MMTDFLEEIKNITDHVLLFGSFAAMAEWLPTFVLFLSALWYMIRIGSFIYDKFKGDDKDEKK